MSPAAAATARLGALRSRMAAHGIAAYVVPTEDPHQSEYIAPCHARRARLTGFTGSAGVAVVTQTHAALWTDGRYFLQASRELADGWTLMRSGLPGVKTKEDWLVDVLPDASAVGVDPQVLSLAAADALRSALAAHGHVVRCIAANLVDADWNDRPSLPQHKVSVLADAGESHASKIARVRGHVADHPTAWGVAVSQLDEVAWLLNLRGSDIEFNPVFFAYVIVTRDSVLLFADNSKLDSSVIAHLGPSVTVRPYSAVFEELTALAAKHKDSQQNKLLVDGRTSLALVDAAGGDSAIIRVARPFVQLQKALKNPIEIDGFKKCHLRDGAALCNYFAWLENELVNKNTVLTEVEASDKLEEFRKQQDKFVGLSFTTISSTGPNAAIIHYHPEHGKCAVIDKSKIYLCDSGGQYLDGTTDVTRTLHFGTPIEREKHCNTLVLKGHIAIDQLVFPKGTTGYILDAFARKDLWKSGLDFRHGTGHGVGSFLNVHEGPQGIGQRIAYNDVPLEAGMTITNEPGYYEDNAFGIRIESVLICKVANTENRFGDNDFLCFENITFAPIQTALVNVDMLTASERDWINKYHAQVLEKILPLVKDNKLTVEWLKRECKPI